MYWFGVISVGSVFDGKYRIESVLGRGGMSVVYGAAHLRLPRRVAIKVLHSHLDDLPAYARFRREAELLSELRHPNIVAAHDFDEVDGHPYLVMECLEGQDLARLLARRKRLEVGEALVITRQISDALTAAHSRRVIHRDLKPQNVFLCTAVPGELPLVKLLDFGVSKLLGAPNALTHSLTTIGTPSYMSPEQARGSSALVDARSDQFSLAVLVYEMLAGRLPFDPSDEPLVTMTRILTDEPPPIAEVPESLMPVLWRALAKRPEERWPSVAAFVAALEQAAAGLDVEGRIPTGIGNLPETLPGEAEQLVAEARGRIPRWVAVAVGVALAGTTLALAWLRPLVQVVPVPEAAARGAQPSPVVGAGGVAPLPVMGARGAVGPVAGASGIVPAAVVGGNETGPPGGEPASATRAAPGEPADATRPVGGAPATPVPERLANPGTHAPAMPLSDDRRMASPTPASPLSKGGRAGHRTVRPRHTTGAQGPAAADAEPESEFRLEDPFSD
jgi:serine/threonine-protein kinase